MDVAKLRKEFIEQINYLRKVILNSINPKKLQGQELSEEMFINLLWIQVNMINEGALPIIKTAWTYIKQKQSLLAKKRYIEDYSKKIKELENKFPMKEEYLKNIVKKNNNNHSINKLSSKAKKKVTIITVKKVAKINY